MNNYTDLVDEINFESTAQITIWEKENIFDFIYEYLYSKGLYIKFLIFN